MARTLWLFDCAEIAEMSGLHRVGGPVEKIGPVTIDGEPWDREPCLSFAGTIIEHDGGWRLYYSWRRDAVSRLALAESDDGLAWRRVDLGQNATAGGPGNHFAIAGLDPCENVIQPQVVRTAEGDWRMYAWLHAHDRGVLRYVIAESGDGISWKLRDIDRPAVFHPADREVGQNGWVAGLTRASAEDRFADRRTYDWMEAKRLRSNDATYVYRAADLGQGDGYVMYSVWLVPNRPESGRYFAHDNAAKVCRTIHRRTSADGLAWGDPDLLISPDPCDPLEQQFYYLCAEPMGTGEDAPLVGYIGNYRVGDQTMDIELAFSRDGIRWARPLRGGWMPRGGPDEIDAGMVQAPNRTIPLGGGRRLMLYTGRSILHNHTLAPGVAKRRQAIMGAIARGGRLVGLRANEGQTGRLLTRPFIPAGAAIAVDADVRGGRLRAELCDPFGAPFEGYRLLDADPVSGDGRFALTWGGKDSGAYRYDAVQLRIEIAGGTLYRIET